MASKSRPFSHASTHSAQGSDPISIALSSATPAAPGTAAAGSATLPARADHVHAVPTPSQVGSPPVVRAVAAGKGLTGGGDLTADRTLSIAAPSGFLAKDHDPGSATYTKGVIATLKTFDVGTEGCFIIQGLYLPPTQNANLKTRLLISFQDGTSLFIENAQTGTALTQNAQGFSNLLMGDAANNQNAANDGKAVRKLSFEVRNADGQNDITADLGAFRVRAYCMPIGGGSIVIT